MTTPATQSAPFEREERYIVFKKSHLTQKQIDTLDKLRTPPTIPPAKWHDDHTMPTIECVVIEADWPEYGPVWAMIEARMTGQAHSLPGDVGMREAADEIASIITPGNFWNARTIGDLTGWCDRLQTRIRALAAFTPSALSGDAGEGE